MLMCRESFAPDWMSVDDAVCVETADLFGLFLSAVNPSNVHVISSANVQFRQSLVVQTVQWREAVNSVFGTQKLLKCEH